MVMPAQKPGPRWPFVVIGEYGRPVMNIGVLGRLDADLPYAMNWWSYFGPSSRDVATLLITTHWMFYWPPGSSLTDPPRRASSLPLYGRHIDPATDRIDSTTLEVIVDHWLERIVDGQPSKIPELVAEIEPPLNGAQIWRRAEE